MARSIIDIDVRDAAFKQFQVAFAKYQQAVKAMPGDWAKVGSAATAANTQFANAADELAKTQGVYQRIVSAQALIEKQAKDSAKTFTSIRKTTLNIAKDVASVTWNLGKWAALGGAFGLATSIGGLFGMSGLASSASSLRRSSQGLGVSPGELRAADLNYSRYLDVNSTLGNIGNAQSDLSKRWIFSALGLSAHDVQNRSAADLLPDMLPKIISRFKQFGGTVQGAQASGIDQLVDFQTLRRLASLSPDELKNAAAGYRKDRSALATNDETLRNWQNLNAQLQRAGYTLENTFLKGLERLAGPLERLSGSFAHAVEIFFKSDKVGEWLDKLGDGMERFAKYMTTDEFEHDVKSFVSGVAALARAIESTLRFLGIISTPSDADTLGTEGRRSGAARLSPRQALEEQQKALRGGWNHNVGNIRYPGSTQFQSFASDDEGLRAMARQLRLYYNGQSAAAGHRRLDTLSDIISTYAPAKDGNDVAAYIADVTKRSGYGANEHLNMNDPSVLSRVMAAMAKHENKLNNFTPAQVQQAITVENATGGNAVISMRQLAH